MKNKENRSGKVRRGVLAGICALVALGVFFVLLAAIRFCDTVSQFIVFAALLLVLSAGAAVFLFWHNGKRERALAAEIASLEKEKQLQEEILRQQEQVFRRQKLETVGMMTAGIAHEFNNLLSPIMGNSMLILEKSRAVSPEIFESALEIYQASDRARELIAKISKLTRGQAAPTKVPVMPGKLLSDILSMSAASIPNNIAINKVIRTGKTVSGDESQLVYMLLNLIINAVQAMKPQGGTLTVTADAVGENVCFSVEDTGPGIPEENLKWIFDPFFTTKEAGKGTGLGLPIAKHIAEDHGGSIRAENRPEGGARFTVILPAIPDGE